MGENISWLKARKRRKQILVRLKKILGGSAIAALIVGPLIYFGVAAQETAQILEGDLRNKALREASITPEVSTSDTPIEFPEKVEVKKPIKKEGYSIEIKQDKFPENLKTTEIAEEIIAFAPAEEEKIKIAEEFQKNIEEIEIKKLETNYDGFKGSYVILNNVTIDYGPAEIKNDADANAAARTAVQKYLNTLEDGDNYAVLKDTTKLDQNKKPGALVISSIKNNNGKWYVNFKQYNQLLPVFDGNLKLIFTEKKKLLVLTDNIKRNLPAESDFQVGTAVVNESTKELFEWDETLDEIQFINKGYYKGKPVYKVETRAHNPLGQWDIYVNGVDGTIEGLMSDIRIQDEPLPPEESTPAEEPSPIDEPVTTVTTEEPAPADEPVPAPTDEPVSPEEPAAVEPVAEETATTEPEILPPEITEITEEQATPEPEIQVLETLLSQVLGKIFQKTPADVQEILPFSNEYVYINQTRITTDAQGYFDNPGQSWYSLFLEGPYVTVNDNDATVNADIINQTPADPFTWDENSASLAAINAFYHTNKIRQWVAENFGYEINHNIPVTVNSQLVDDYLGGCGAWFDIRDNTIEIGRGGYEGEKDGIRSSCMNDLNYALSSDIIYHEYAHFIIEDITHLPNITGAESAAMAEGLTDYFAATINNDSIWGDVITVRTRNLQNTLNYQTDMTGDSHYDGQILSGALWDLRTEIGAEATDKLIFNTLFQDRIHFETFMYGMIIEDDDNADFSDGTPHLIAILEAFEKHGIGPGVLNFTGLPISPEDWSVILGEEVPVGEENPLYASMSGTGCHPVGADPNFTELNVYNGTCTITSATTIAGDVYVYDSIAGSGNGGGGTLAVSGGNLTLSSSGALYIGNNGTYDSSFVDVTASRVLSSSVGINYIYATGWLRVYDGGSATLNNAYDYGEVRAGSTTTTGTITVNGTFYNYNGGNIYTNTCATCSTKIDVNGTLYFYGGSTATIAQYSTLEATLLQMTGASALYSTLSLYGTLNGASTTLDINLRGYDSTYRGRIYVYSTGALYVDEFAIGDTSNYGGYLSNSGTVTADNIYLYNSGAIYNPNSVTANSLAMNNSTSINNTGTLTQGYSVGSISMNEDCTLTNSGTLRAYGSISMDEITTEVGLGPEINNTGEVRIQAPSATYYSYNTLYMYDDAIFTNGTSGTTTTGTLYVTNDITMRNNATINNYYAIYQNYAVTNDSTSNLDMQASSVFNNGDSTSYYYNYRSGTYYGHTFVYDNSVITNYGSFNTFRLWLGNYSPSNITGGTFNNENAGNLIVNDTGGTAFEIFRATLDHKAGADELRVDGTTLMRGASGDVAYLNLNGDASSVLLYAMTINDYGTLQSNITGTIVSSTLTMNNNNSRIQNPGSITFGGAMTMNNNAYIDNGGTLSGSSSLTINNNVDTIRDIYNLGTITITSGLVLNNYATIDNYGGTFTANSGVTTNDNSVIFNRQSGGVFNVRGSDLSMFDSSSVANSASGTFNVGTSAAPKSITMRNTTDITNSAAFNVYGNINLSDETCTGNEARILNTGTFNVDDQAATDTWDNIVTVCGVRAVAAPNNYSIRNNGGGTFSIDYLSGDDADGLLYVHNNSMIDNGYTETTAATLRAQKFQLGNSATAKVGGTIVNYYTGTIRANSSNYGIDIYRGRVQNNAKTTVTTEILLPNNGYIKVDGASGDVGVYQSAANSTGQLLIEPFGKMEFLSASTHTTGFLCQITEDGSGNNGNMTVYSGGSVTCADFYNGTQSYSPGTVINGGSITATNAAYFYEDSTNPDTNLEYDGSATSSLTVYSNLFIGDSVRNGGQFTNLGDVWAAYLNIDGNADVTNGSSSDHTSTLIVENNIGIWGTGSEWTYLYNYGVIEGDSLTLNEEKPVFNNYAGANTDLIGDAIINGATIDNYATFNVDGATEVRKFNTSYGKLYNQNATAAFTTLQLNIGKLSTLTPGGFLYNYNGASFTVTSTADTAAELYKTTGASNDSYISNTVNSTLTINGKLTVRGTNSFGPSYAFVFNGTVDDHTSTLTAGSISVFGYSTIDNRAIINVTGAFSTDDNPVGIITLNNYSGGDFNASQLMTFTSPSYTTINNFAGADMDLSTSLNLYYSTNIFNNYSTFDAGLLKIGIISGGYPGGTFNNLSGGDVHITNTTSTAAEIIDGGSFVHNGIFADTVTIDGTLTIQSSTTTSNYSSSSDSGLTQVADVVVNAGGFLRLLGTTVSAGLDIVNTGAGTGSLTVSGTGPSALGNVLIEGGEIEIDGPTNINAYGKVENQSDYGTPTQGGFFAKGLITVASNGTLTSNNSSFFNLSASPTSLQTTGTVELSDDMSITGAINITGGTTRFGMKNNVGYTYVGGKITVTGTPPVMTPPYPDNEDAVYLFRTYNNVYDAIPGSPPAIGFHDIEVNGSNANMLFGNDTDAVDSCDNDIYGDLKILNGGTVKINCSTTSPSAVNVRSGSPGGLTQVEGTLIINTNLTTETMIVGNGTTLSGKVTHDTVTSTGAESTTFDLWVTETLTVNSNGEMNVDGKANFYGSGGAADRGGSYGGIGQYGNSSSPFNQYGYMGAIDEQFGRCGVTDTVGVVCQGDGGGRMTILIGAFDGTHTGQLILNSPGKITANGGSATTGGGSGGNIVIITDNTISGTGPISANGGNSNGGTYSTAGGGGRIFIAHYAEDTFKPLVADFTGTISAVGGLGSVTSKYAGTGTITKFWTSEWGNQNDGTIYVDAFSNAPDINNDSTTNSTDVTTLVIPSPGVESVQGENNAWVNIYQTSYLQQCVKDSTSTVNIGSPGVNMNRDHGPLLTTTCMFSPDPPRTLHLNNSATGAATAYEGEYDDTQPHVVDLTPAATAFHYDARLDSDDAILTPVQNAIKYQLQISTNVDDLYTGNNGGSIVTGCNLDNQTFNSPGYVADNTRSIDLLIPSTCGNNLTVNTNYYWRIRFLQDTPSTTDDHWGLWSETNTFKIDEGAIVELSSCNDSNTSYVLGDYDTELGSNFHTAWCKFATDATVLTSIYTQKTQPFQIYDGIDIRGTIWDMETLDHDLLTGMDGKTLAGTETNELGFYVSAFTGAFTVQTSASGQDYDDAYTYLSHVSPAKILVSAGGYSDESFILNIGAFIHGLLNAANPITSAPVFYCGEDGNVAPCITRPGPLNPLDGYTSVVQVIATPTP